MNGLICFIMILLVLGIVYQYYSVIQHKRAHSLAMEWMGLAKKYDLSIRAALLSIPDKTKMKVHYQEAIDLEEVLIKKLTVLTNLKHKSLLDKTTIAEIPQYNETYQIMRQSKEIIESLLRQEN